jgi:hypothetical protein
MGLSRLGAPKPGLAPDLLYRIQKVTHRPSQEVKANPRRTSLPSGLSDWLSLPRHFMKAVNCFQAHIPIHTRCRFWGVAAVLGDDT